MSKKTVVLIGVQFTPRQVSKYRLDSLRENYDFEYWDCSAIIEPHYAGLDTIAAEFVHVISNFYLFRKNVCRIPKDTVVIIDFNPDANIKLTKLLSRKFQNVVRFDFWATTSRTILSKMRDDASMNRNIKSAKSATRTMSAKLKLILYKSLYIKYLIKISATFFRNIKNNPIEHLKVQWGDFLYELANKLLKITWISTDLNSEFAINLFDYECYLEDRNKARMLPYKYACFLDVNYPHLPDLQIHESEINWDEVAKEYYSSMNEFFNHIEEQYQIKVVIAAHPSVNMTVNPWNGRPCIVYKTSEIVKDCEFAMIHCSNSISYAFLYDKPLLILNNKAIHKSNYISSLTLPYSEAFRINICDTDTCVDVKPYVRPINREIRQKFLSAFFNMDNPQNNSILISKHIESIYKKWYNK